MAGPKTQIFDKCLKSKKKLYFNSRRIWLAETRFLAFIPDSSGTDPGTTKQATEDVDYRQDDNVQVQAVPLLILQTGDF